MQGWPFLSDWGKTLEDFKRAVTTRMEHTRLLDSEADPGMYNLLRSFVGCAKTRKAAKATMNLAIASLDIANRLRTKPQEGDMFPELPASFDDWGIEGQEQLSTEEASILRSLFASASKTNSLRLPLELASLLSPIILLAPINLHKQSVNSSELVKVETYASVSIVNLNGTGQVATLAGSNKPHIIITIEKLIWNTIFAVARGDVDLPRAVENLAESFPWVEVETENQIDWVRHWFDGFTDYEAAAMGVSETRRSISPQEDGGPTGISARDAEVEGQNNADDGLYHEMDIDLVDAISSPTIDSSVIKPNHQPTIAQRSHDHTSALFTPEYSPEALPRQSLFLFDSEISEEEKNPIHLVRQAPFSECLISKDHCVYDNHHERHIITSVIWVSEGVLRR